MDEDSVTDTESESEYDLESNTGSDSLSDDDGGKRGKKKKRKKRRAKGCSQYLRETVKNESELPVTCGDKKGTFHVEKYHDSQKCILSEGQWFMPNEFERFGGKARNKKWKTSILYKGIPLQKLIEDGCLTIFRKANVQNEQDDSPESSPITKRLRKRKDECLSSNKKGGVRNEQDSSPESSPITNRLRKRRSSQDRTLSSPLSSESDERDNNERLSSVKKRRVQNEQDKSPESSPATRRPKKRRDRKETLPFNSESDERDEEEDDDDDDDIDMTLFKGPTLPVTSGSDSGVLHKYRFATGHCGKCIRTNNFWLTPDDFIRLTKPDGRWRKDILCHGIPLGKLIMKRVLVMHMINCDCDVCQDLDQYLNDDECFACDSEACLVCCDDCPRAFHSDCHLPAVDKDSLGNQWSCSFCVMKMKGFPEKQDVLCSPVSKFTLHCQCLLLNLLHESKTDPSTNVPGNSENICGLMLNGVKQKLERNGYQTVQDFVTDIKDKFCTSSKDNQSKRRLEEIFNREFKTIFKPV